ncbi:MAG: ABC transporter permease [Gammaproteobacteria bacterium]|nr:ABC transporter permease [Gammaproteobacteria bacterium]
MFRPLAVNIGLRYAHSRASFISFVSVLSLAGLAISVAVLLFVQGIVAGFEREMNDRVLAIVPHVTVTGHAPLHDFRHAETLVAGVDGVAGVAAVVEGGALLATPTRVAGVNLVGVDPGSYAGVSRVFDFAELAEPLAAGRFNVVLGVGLASRLGVWVGDSVTAVLPEATVTPLGTFARQKRLKVAGLVNTGSQLDRAIAYLAREDAGRLFRLGDAVHGLHVAGNDPLQADAVRSRVTRVLGAHRVRGHSWFSSLGNLYNAIGVTKNMLFLLLSLLIAVAAFNLVSSLVMVVNERRGDIAMLRTMGSPLSMTVTSFAVLGLVIAGIGVAIGVGGGLVLGVIAEAGFPWLEAVLGVPLMGEYLITTLPVAFAVDDVARVVGTALALCLLATLLPAWRVAHLNPAEVLRHE